MQPLDRRTTPAGSTRKQPVALFVVAGLLLVARIVAGFYEAQHPPGFHDYVQWQPIAHAEEQARKADKPVLYVFFDGSQEACRKMEREVFGDRKAAEKINTDFVPVKIPEERSPVENQSLVDRYKVTTFPTLVVVDPALKEPQILKGYPDKSKIEGFLTDISVRLSMIKDK